MGKGGLPCTVRSVHNQCMHANLRTLLHAHTLIPIETPSFSKTLSGVVAACFIFCEYERETSYIWLNESMRKCARGVASR